MFKGNYEMLIANKDHIQIDHVMYQPIFHCTAGCRGCYIAASPSSKYNGPVNTEILDLIFKTKKVSCRQLTISLDTMKEAPPEELLSALGVIWNNYWTSRRDYFPDLCVTAHDWTTLVRWAKWMKISTRDFIAPLTVLSLSRFPIKASTCEQIKEITTKTKTTLNYNRLAEPITRKIELANGIQYADHIYLVYKKNPLGSKQSVKELQNLRNLYDHVLSMRSDRNTITIDKCISDSLQHNKTGKTCGAAISKVHVWPDGSTTGCPYNSHHIGQKRNRELIQYNTWQSLQDTIVNRACHPMGHCKIPNMLQEISNRSRSDIANPISE